MSRRRQTPRRKSRPAPRLAPAAELHRLDWRLWSTSRTAAVMAGAAALIVGLTAWSLSPSFTTRLRTRAEDAEARRDWPAALAAWRELNATRSASARSWLAEARAATALELAAQAEAALIHACEADPADSRPWRLRLDLLRAEGRTAEAARVGWAAYNAVPPGAQRPILRELTLALLLDDDLVAGVAEDRGRARVERWAAADPDDLDALTARHRRLAAEPRPGDPDLAAWAGALTGLVARRPDSAAAREALATALADLGEPDRARAVLDAWPAAARDARYDRLDGRLALDYESNPARALAALERVAEELPQDWRARTLLARAYRALDRLEDAARQAEVVARLRERLNPATLVPRLAADLARPDDPRSIRDLAALCSSVGLDRLADAWRREASAPPFAPRP